MWVEKKSCSEVSMTKDMKRRKTKNSKNSLFISFNQSKINFGKLYIDGRMIALWFFFWDIKMMRDIGKNM